jgi:iron complex outermembrane recepter protein
MTYKISRLLLIFLIPARLFSQGIIEGVVKDELNGESLIGVNIVYGAGKGTVSDIDGHYSISLPKGSYEITASYVGYEPQTVRVNVADSKVVLDFNMKTIMLSEVEVVGDMARSRETPVAFSTIKPLKLEEELASQDIPMILNSTPGVYATQQGGGDGDARINIRGFSQRNVAVMIDGIPVNDMENGWVYWSNWFGLDLVTQRIQVQRGLGASKLAQPSVGGTMNILTAGIQQKRLIKIRQEVANDGYLRTSVSYNSGELPHGWGITAAGSFKTGDGWVEQTYSKGWFYYLKIDKKLGNHLLSLTGMGAPQEHGQRKYQKPMATYDSTYAREHGVDAPPSDYYYSTYIDTNYMVNKGIRYNADWGSYTDTLGNKNIVNEKVNYYHKPQFTLRDFWNINKKVYLSNIVYLSLGNGGGTQLNKSVRASSGSLPGYITPDGQIDFQRYYDENIHPGPLTQDSLYPSEIQSFTYIKSSVNNHKWFGLLSTLNYTIDDHFTFSGGIDLRRYRGEHYQEVYDLLGGTYVIDQSDPNRFLGQRLREGDIISFHDDGLVESGGLFSQLEYLSGNISAFVNLTGAYSGYKKIDYFQPKVITVGDTTLEIIYGQPDTLNGVIYDQNTPGLKYQESDWYWKPGFTFKAGANYNLSERSNIFLNAGYLSKAPRFNNVFNLYDLTMLTNIVNENIAAVEVGYTYNSKSLNVNANTYFTDWKNAPGNPVSFPIEPGVNGYYNIKGMDARHIGIEVDASWNILKNLEAEGLVSLGDWRWTSADSVDLYDQNNNYIRTNYFDARGVHVGDAAQTQFAASLRWEIIKYLYIKGQFTYFDRYYSEFNPFDLNPATNPAGFDTEGNPIDTWIMPSYFLVDLHAGYSFKVSKIKFDIRGSVLNLLNTTYVSDASNNDEYTTVTKDNDAKSAAVFFGMGRRFSTSLTISF